MEAVQLLSVNAFEFQTILLYHFGFEILRQLKTCERLQIQNILLNQNLFEAAERLFIESVLVVQFLLAILGLSVEVFSREDVFLHELLAYFLKVFMAP